MSVIVVVRGNTNSGAARLRVEVDGEPVAVAIEVGNVWTLASYIPGLLPTARLDALTEADAREWLQWIGALVDEKRCRVAT